MNFFFFINREVLSLWARAHWGDRVGHAPSYRTELIS